MCDDFHFIQFEENIEEMLPWRIDERNVMIVEDVLSSFMYDCEYSLDGKYLAISSYLEVYIFDVANGKVIHTLKDHQANIFCATFSQDSQMFATCSNDCTIIIYDLQNFSILRRFTNDTFVSAICFSHCCNYLYSGDEYGQLKKWDIKNGSILLEETIHSSWIWKLSLSPNGIYILSCGHYLAKLIDLIDFSVVYTFQHDNYVRAGDFHSSKNIVAVGDRSKKIKLWNIESGLCLYEFDIGGEVWDLHFLAPNLLLTMSGDGFICSYDVNTYQQCQKVYCNCICMQFSFAISPDKTQLTCGPCKTKIIKRYPIMRHCDDACQLQLIELSKRDATVLSNIIKMNIDNSVVRQLVSGGIDMSEDEYNIIIDRCWDLVDINEKNGGNMHEFVNKKGDELSDNDDD
eukprot:TRINITY_DN3266_c1_g6_i2.p1 TRINITY_DN3266_c1_g6~~TRINITY_DN3266_c1_g6_i2.p1  ORF type:complete len:402 (-),score=89.32 TRINITY_DN3266_c1_g6_i2:291-1496(-)